MEYASTCIDRLVSHLCAKINARAHARDAPLQPRESANTRTPMRQAATFDSAPSHPIVENGHADVRRGLEEDVPHEQVGARHAPASAGSRA